MRTKPLVPSILLAALAASLPADEIAHSDREEIYRRYREFPSLVVGGSVTAHWMADGSSFWYAEGAPAETVIYRVDPDENERTELFDTARLRTALARVLRHEPPYRGLPFDTFTLIEEEAKARFTVEGQDFVVDLDSYEIEKARRPSEAEKLRSTPQFVRKGFTDGSSDVMEHPSPDGRFFLTERGDDLWLRSSADGRGEPLTDDGESDFAWSLGNSAWAPSGTRLAAWKTDTRGIPKLPLIHWLKVTEEVEWTRPYIKTGGRMGRSECYIVDVASKGRVRVEGIEPEHHYYAHGFRRDGSELVVFRVDRAFKRLDVLAADAGTGESRVVLTETQPTFIEGLRFLLVWRDLMTPLEDGERFLWLSERDGFRHVYLYDYDGRLIRQLTEGEYPVLRVAAVDEDEGWVYFEANGDRGHPYDTHLYRVRLESPGAPERLTEARGEHEVQISPSKAYFVDTHSTVERPPRAELRTAAGELVRVLSEAEVEGLREELRWSPPETFVVKADDGETDLHGVLYKPWDFDPENRYPVLDSIYNGPFVTWAPQSFVDGRGMAAQAMAQLGYVVMIVDGRGTPERGKAFQDVVYRNFGRHEIPDHAAALKQVATARPYMDLGRVGIYGGSWGGYMTIRALLLAPDVYHVGVATNSVSDLEDHAAISIEGYMGLLHENPEGYAYASSLKMADRLAGKLYLIHGTSDVNAPFSATMRMAEALIRANKPFDLLAMPGQSHWFTGAAAEYADEARRRYFEEHLKP